MEEYKNEFNDLLNPLEEDIRWYSDFIYPKIELSTSVIIKGKFRVLPVDDGNFHKITTLSEFEKIEEHINDKLDRFTSKFDLKQMIDYIYSNQSSNVIVNLDPAEKIIHTSIAESTLAGKVTDEKSKKMIQKLSKFDFSREELEYTVRELSHLNIIIGTSNLQRQFRRKLEEIIATAKTGVETPLIGDVIRFLKITHWIVRYDLFKFHLEKGIPIYFIENDIFTMAYIPQIERASLKDQDIGTIWQHRLDLLCMNLPISSTDHPYQLLLDTKWEERNQALLEQLNSEFDICPKEIVKFYPQSTLSHYAPLLSEEYSPFAMIEQSNGQELYFTSPIQIADAKFRFIWQMRTTEHFKVYGTHFEDYVSNKLDECKQYLTIANRYFKKLQYDQLFYKKPVLFVIDSKDLKLIESIDDRKKMASRKSKLKKYCKYILKKTKLIQDNLDEFIELFGQFKGIEFLVPVIITHNPEYYFEFNNVGIITLMEFLSLHEDIFQSISDGKREIALTINPTGKLSYAFHFQAIEI